MPEFIQVKIDEQNERNLKLPGLKKALGAFEIRVQKENQVTTHTKVKTGDGNRTETEYIPPSVLLTISGIQLATEAKIVLTLKKYGITVLKCTSKISW
jgi:hypothetical protein